MAATRLLTEVEDELAWSTMRTATGPASIARLRSLRKTSPSSLRAGRNCSAASLAAEAAAVVSCSRCSAADAAADAAAHDSSDGWRCSAAGAVADADDDDDGSVLLLRRVPFSSEAAAARAARCRATSSLSVAPLRAAFKSGDASSWVDRVGSYGVCLSVLCSSARAGAGAVVLCSSFLESRQASLMVGVICSSARATAFNDSLATTCQVRRQTPGFLGAVPPSRRTRAEAAP